MKLSKESGAGVSETGFTKARSMGCVAEAVERAGGCVARVFRKAELPLRLIEAPDQLILLKDQLAVVEYAARELDDETLPLRLSMLAGIAGLGPFGQRVGAAPTLREAIDRCNSGMTSMLQSATHMRLDVRGGEAAWSYFISDGARLGRERNELLAFGYMAETLRHFCAGPPMRAELPSRPAARGPLESLLGCEILPGETARLVFAREHLERANPRRPAEEAGFVADVPQPSDFLAGVEHLVRLGLLERRPTIDYVGARLSMSTRGLQRRLAGYGQSFEAIRRRILLENAKAMLADPGRRVTDIAYELGYSDPAHFSRAFAAMTGESPRVWRRGSMLASPARFAAPVPLATPAAKA
jgi:AraC-like DNA-binding protein